MYKVNVIQQAKEAKPSRAELKKNLPLSSFAIETRVKCLNAESTAATRPDPMRISNSQTSVCSTGWADFPRAPRGWHAESARACLMALISKVRTVDWNSQRNTRKSLGDDVK